MISSIDTREESDEVKLERYIGWRLDPPRIPSLPELPPLIPPSPEFASLVIDCRFGDDVRSRIMDHVE